MKALYKTLIIVLLLQACSEHKEEKVTQQALPCLSGKEVNTLIEPQLKSVNYTITLNGKIVYNPNNVVQYVSLVDGIITNTYVSLGDEVKKGQVIAAIKSTELNAMQSELKQLQAQLKVAQRDLASTESFYKSGISSEKDLIASQSELTQIESQIANLRTNLKLFSAKPEAGVFEIVAPVGGYIVGSQMASGLQINAGSEPLFTLSNLDEVWVNANIYPQDISHVSEGMQVSITGNAFPDKTFGGTISKISNVIDPNDNVIKARVILENKDLQLKPGLNVTVNVEKNLDKKALYLPKRSVIFNNDLYYVMTASQTDNCQLVSKQVTILEQDKNGYYIASGITSKDKIVEKDALLWYNAYANN